jgi:hypothetical protein
MLKSKATYFDKYLVLTHRVSTMCPWIGTQDTWNAAKSLLFTERSAHGTKLESGAEHRYSQNESRVYEGKSKLKKSQELKG